MAQFSHPELGGPGQWSRGGMTMIGDMFNDALKTKVKQLCSELAGHLSLESSAGQPESTPLQKERESSVTIPATGAPSGDWWGADLGRAGLNRLTEQHPVCIFSRPHTGSPSKRVLT